MADTRSGSSISKRANSQAGSHPTVDERPSSRSSKHEEDRPSTRTSKNGEDRPSTRTSKLGEDRPSSRSSKHEDDRPSTRSSKNGEDRPSTRSSKHEEDRPSTRSSKHEDDRPSTRSSKHEDDRPSTRTISRHGDQLGTEGTINDEGSTQSDDQLNSDEEIKEEIEVEDQRKKPVKKRDFKKKKPVEKQKEKKRRDEKLQRMKTPDFTHGLDMSQHDVELVVGKQRKRLLAHRALLSIWSEWFEEKLSSSAYDQVDVAVIEMPQYKPEDISHLLAVIYPPNRDVTDKTASLLLRLSKDLKIADIPPMCEKCLEKRRVSCDLLFLSQQYDLQDLRTKCINTMKLWTLRELEREKQFKDLNSETKVELFTAKVQHLESKIGPLQKRQNTISSKQDELIKIWSDIETSWTYEGNSDSEVRQDVQENAAEAITELRNSKENEQCEAYRSPESMAKCGGSVASSRAQSARSVRSRQEGAEEDTEEGTGEGTEEESAELERGKDEQTLEAGQESEGDDKGTGVDDKEED